jgi:hypothetical protein
MTPVFVVLLAQTRGPKRFAVSMPIDLSIISSAF